MATKKATTKRCIGSNRFGIEPHEAPVTDFGAQSASPDGLSRMCRAHWKVYAKALREAAVEREPSSEPAVAKATTKARRAAPMAHIPTREATRKAARPSANGGALAKAAALIAEVDALPAPEMVARVGDDDVQAALETVAGHQGTPLGETIATGTGEADAA